MLEQIQSQWREYLPADAEPVSADDKLKLSKDEWRARLADPMAFEVLRREGTERAFTSPLNDEKRDGVFLCAGCDLPVYTSAMKYESGTGWPSFFTTIPVPSRLRKTSSLFYRAPSIIAPVAEDTTAMCLKMVPPRLANAGATTALR
jgi:peptide-methionine (R)-S-oxide reductase